jgi:uncharacterized Zn-finger protein
VFADKRNRAHEAEKGFECAFCSNKFKNENEATRHENSLHIRHNSLSCSHLSGYDRTFQKIYLRVGELDICGYCGDSFPRSGRDDMNTKYDTDQDWDERMRHWQEDHMFRECNLPRSSTERTISVSI